MRGILMKKNVKNITDILESESVRIEIVHQELEGEFPDKQSEITVTITDKILEKYFISIADDVLEKARKAEEQARRRMAEKTLDF